MKPIIEFKHLSKFEDIEIQIKEVKCTVRPHKVIIYALLSCHGFDKEFKGICKDLEMYNDIVKSTRFKDVTKLKMKIRLIQYQISNELEAWIKECEKKHKIKSLESWNKEMEQTRQKHLSNGKPYYAETLEGLINRNKLELLTIQS